MSEGSWPSGHQAPPFFYPAGAESLPCRKKYGVSLPALSMHTYMYVDRPLDSDSPTAGTLANCWFVLCISSRRITPDLMLGMCVCWSDYRPINGESHAALPETSLG